MEEGRVGPAEVAADEGEKEVEGECPPVPPGTQADQKLFAVDAVAERVEGAANERAAESAEPLRSVRVNEGRGGRW